MNKIKNQKILGTFFLLSIAFSLTGCPSRKKSESPNPWRTVYMGNVLSLVENTKNRPIPPHDDLKKLNNRIFYSTAAIEFKSIGSYNSEKVVNRETILRDNAATSKEETSDRGEMNHAFSFKASDRYLEIYVNRQNGENTSTLIARCELWAKPKPIKTSSNVLGVPCIYFEDRSSQSGKLVHFSVSRNQNVFSLLFYSNYPKQGETLEAYYFNDSITDPPMEKTHSRQMPFAAARRGVQIHSFLETES